MDTHKGSVKNVGSIMLNTIKILSDMTKKDTEKCLVIGWFVLMDHIN